MKRMHNAQLQHGNHPPTVKNRKIKRTYWAFPIPRNIGLKTPQKSHEPEVHIETKVLDGE